MGLYYELQVVAHKTGLSPKTLRVWIEEGLVTPRRQGKKIVFSENDLARVLLIRRLRDDLGVNLAGIDIILDLLDRLKSLEQEVARLRAELETKGLPLI
ncbi:chaperone modulator CbpM [Thermodesulfatator atlanticus]